MNTEKEIEQLKKIVVEEINAFIIDSRKIEWDDIPKRNKQAVYVKARTLMAVLLKDLIGMRLVDIGKIIKRDHSAVTYLCNNAHVTLYNSEKSYRQVYDNIISRYLGMKSGSDYITYDLRQYLVKILSLEDVMREMKTELVNLLSGEVDKEKEKVRIQKQKLLKELLVLEKNV